MQKIRDYLGGVRGRGCLLLLVCLLAGCAGEPVESDLQGIILEETEEASDETSEGASEEVDSGDSEVTKKESIYVYVCGQVTVPGVYELPEGSRIHEAIAAAGGMLATASGESLNLAEQMADGQKIYVPSVQEVQSGATGVDFTGDFQKLPVDDDRVNINLADQEELMMLTGIGEKKAQAILAYRERHGRFGSVEELMRVEGIKEGTYEKIKDQIKIE